MELSRIEEALYRVFAYAEGQGYAGYNKFDALNSPYLKKISLENKWLRLILTQLVMHSPINIRRALGVEKSINPKGMALFAMAYLNEYQRTGSHKTHRQATHCLEWLRSVAVRTPHGLGWGYCFDWQSTLFYAPKFSPNAIVTTMCGEAFVKAYEVLKEDRYLEVARLAAHFLRYDLPTLHETADELCVAYVPSAVRSVVLNINASAGAQLAKVAAQTSDNRLGRDARRMISFVVNRRTPYYAWYYTHPPGNSYIMHDNYHTGGILDAIMDYGIYCNDPAFEDIYLRGLQYYAENLFLPDGTPKHMNDSVHPIDIHGAAQGIISFSKASTLHHNYLELAERTAQWTLHNMVDRQRGCFFYQKGRLFTKRFTLMRWCNAWMAKALTDLLAAEDEQRSPSEGHLK